MRTEDILMLGVGFVAGYYVLAHWGRTGKTA